MKNKINMRKVGIIAGGVIAGVGTVVGSIAIDNLGKKELKNSKSLFATYTRTNNIMSVVIPGTILTSGLLLIGKSMSNNYTNLNNDYEPDDEYDEENPYDEDFDAADLEKSEEYEEKDLLTKIDSESENQPITE